MRLRQREPGGYEILHVNEPLLSTQYNILIVKLLCLQLINILGL